MNVRPVRCRCGTRTLAIQEDGDHERISLHYDPKPERGLFCFLSGTVTDEGFRELLAEICKPDPSLRLRVHLS